MNKTISRYIRQNIKYPLLIEIAPDDKLGIIVVIPCHNEPELMDSIRALAGADRPNCKVEVIVVINASGDDDTSVEAQNIESHNLLNCYTDHPDWISFYSIMNNNFSPKKAGVGLARKIGMDDAVRRFVDLENDRGIIVCFDADSLCESNYFVEIEKHFQNKNVTSASIEFAHPTKGGKYSDDIYNYIAQYELHLRYFINMQRHVLKLPYAYQTVGSSMACTMYAYCAVGGMNQRKAGEDFYFMHKLIKYGGHSDLTTTKVIPSPRISDRVPFGTGKAVGDMAESNIKDYMTYNPKSFIALKQLIDKLPQIYGTKILNQDLPEPVWKYLDTIDGQSNLVSIMKNTTDYPSFEKRFWQWFDAFQLMKYLHFVRDGWYPNIPVKEGADGAGALKGHSLVELLEHHRGF